MRDDRPSLTAAVVAFARSAAAGAEDQITPHLLSGRSRPWLEGAAAGGMAGATRRALIRLGTCGLMDHMALRTAAIDRALADALAAGVRQVVLLGAGLDVRAWRLADLAPAAVWEVDHPASQAFKRRRIGDRRPTAAQVHYVAMDFARDSLTEVLPAAGLDPGQPVFWIWEGVTMYLSAEASRATLAAVAGLSSAGSAVAMTYMLPSVLDLPAVPQQAIHLLFGVIDEPLVGGLTAAGAAELVRDAGFLVSGDGNARDWSRIDGRPAWPGLLFWGERLMIATMP